MDYRHHHAPATSADAPTLFLFHGTGGDETQFLGLGRQILPEAALVAPRGDILEAGAARFFRRLAEGRYDMADLARATAKMRAFVGAKSSAGPAGGARPKTLGLGYSNGANILAATFFAEPALFDAVVLMHPLIPFEPEIALGMAGRLVLITAGRHDPICPPALTERLAESLRAAGAVVETVWHPGGHEIREAEIGATAAFLRAAAAGQEAAA
jgi:phospholipase/carboxylesterase